MESLENIVKPYPTVVQTKQLGTGHAVKAALKKLDGSEKNVLVMFGADPLILPQTIHTIQCLMFLFVLDAIMFS